MTDLPELVQRSLSEETATEFLDRVESQAAKLDDALVAGELDNEDYAIGLEMEIYAVTADTEARDTEDGVTPDKDSTARPQLARLPDTVFGGAAAKELGLHNAEINTDPDVLDEAGLVSQAKRIEAEFESTREAAQKTGQAMILDAMWTLPPAEGSESYLGDVEERDGVTVAKNMRTDPRYVAIDNQALDYADGSVPFSVPGVSRTFPSILFESLATSIQPHLQIPDTASFPAHYNAAIRTLGPVLALATNSPFLPPDLYTDVSDPEQLVAETHHELRIAVFEQSVNQSPNDKVRVPVDIEDTRETIDDVVNDDLFAPFLREWTADGPRESFVQQHWEFQYKRASYWRWLRCVIGGDPVDGAGDERSLRIEYRPLPTQPTIADVVGLQALTVGLIRGLVAREHSLTELPWEDARRCFYDVAENGLEADLAWVDSAGNRVTDAEVVFSEVFEYARHGLAKAGLSETAIDEYLDPVEERWDARMTPSHWKKERVREGLSDGRAFEDAVYAMQREYIDQSRTTETFAEWL